MNALNKIKTEDVVFIDIETVAISKELEKDTPLYEAWSYKSRYQNEINRKTGLEFTTEEYFKEKAALYAPFAKVVCITIGRIVDNSKIVLKSYYGDNEKEILETFNNDLTTVASKNPNIVLCGLNNIGFDEPFLFKRMLINGIRAHVLLDSSDKKPWEVKSIDLSKLFQGSSFYPDSLVAIATALGLPSPKDGIDGSKVTEFYYNGRLFDIVFYCERDVITTANIFRLFKFEPVITEIIVRKSSEKEAPAPLLQRIYMSKLFNDGVKAEIESLTSGKELTGDEKNHLKEILLSVYIDKKDKVQQKKDKKEEIDFFVKGL